MNRNRTTAPYPLRRLDDESLRLGIAYLTKLDRDLARVVALHGPPPLWNRRPGFETLIRIILEQHVSLASGLTVYERVRADLGTVSPKTIRSAGEAGLRELGVTRQKASYMIDAAQRVASDELDLSRISRLSDAEARTALRQVRGVGPWTSDVYLLMALGRPDIWPRGDVALLTALRYLRRLMEPLTNDEAAALAGLWQPWRSVAARILWHGYLQGSLRQNHS